VTIESVCYLTLFSSTEPAFYFINEFLGRSLNKGNFFSKSKPYGTKKQSSTGNKMHLQFFLKGTCNFGLFIYFYFSQKTVIFYKLFICAFFNTDLLTNFLPVWTVNLNDLKVPLTPIFCFLYSIFLWGMLNISKKSTHPSIQYRENGQ
jgi:hypothetical protein